MEGETPPRDPPGPGGAAGPPSERPGRGARSPAQHPQAGAGAVPSRRLLEHGLFLLLLLLLPVHHCHDDVPLLLGQVAQVGQLLHRGRHRRGPGAAGPRRRGHFPVALTAASGRRRRRRSRAWWPLAAPAPLSLCARLHGAAGLPRRRGQPMVLAGARRMEALAGGRRRAPPRLGGGAGAGAGRGEARRAESEPRSHLAAPAPASCGPRLASPRLDALRVPRSQPSALTSQSPTRDPPSSLGQAATRAPAPSGSLVVVAALSDIELSGLVSWRVHP